MRITPEYAALNAQLHTDRPDFGAKGSRWSEHVQKVALMMNSTSILDYGCGKGSLARSVSLPIREYDPGIPGKDADPAPADLVVCTDVLEHIEPYCMQDVLDHLKALTLRAGLFTIHCGPASKNLPDGRNAHVSQHPVPWWIDQLNRRFVIAHLQVISQYTMFVLVRSNAEHARIVAEGIAPQ